MLFYSSCEISVATYCPASLSMYVVVLLNFCKKFMSTIPSGGYFNFRWSTYPPRALPDLTIIVRLTIISPLTIIHLG